MIVISRFPPEKSSYQVSIPTKPIYQSKQLLKTYSTILKRGYLVHWIQSVDPIFIWSPCTIMDLHLFAIAKWASQLVDTECPRGRSQCGTFIHFYGVAVMMTADIARVLWLPVFSCLYGYCTFYLFPLLILFQRDDLQHWIQSVDPISILSPCMIMDLPLF